MLGGSMMDLVEDLSPNWLGWWIENLHWEHPSEGIISIYNVTNLVKRIFWVGRFSLIPWNKPRSGSNFVKFN
jgi:hypothetical protein